MVGKWSNARVYADLYKYTESAIGAAKKVLQKQNIDVKETADKVLELSVIRAKAEQGFFSFRSTTELRVRTGDGIVKEFKTSKRYGTAYVTTAVMERTLAHVVAAMFNDPEILEYLAN